MTEELDRKLARWLEIESEGADPQDDEADAAFGAVLSSAVQERLVPVAFAAVTMRRVAEARAADARRALRMRRAMVAAALVLGPVAVFYGGGLLVSAASWLFVGGLSVIVDTGVRVATVSDWSLWSLFGNLGRATAAVISDSTFTIAMLAMHGIAVAALVALQRLLGPEV